MSLFLFEQCLIGLDPLRKLIVITLISEDPCLFLKQLVGYLDTHGYKVYWKDLTLPEVRHLGVVSKIIIPKMIPLSQSQNIRWLGNLHPNPTKAIVNQYPHPFA